MLNDPLGNMLSLMLNNELAGKPDCLIKPSSRLAKELLRVMKESGYVGDFQEELHSSGNYIKLSLIGSINKCGVIKPRYSVKNDSFEKFEKRFLPAKDVGILIISTPAGVMTHNDAKSKKMGGKLLAYVY